jgi:hypothetical protein
MNIGHWSNEENNNFYQAFKLYNTNWNEIAKYIKTRTATQSRTHYQKILKKNKQKQYLLPPLKIALNYAKKKSWNPPKYIFIYK